MKAVVFDMDGVLIDSEPLWWRAEQAVLAEVGVHLTDEDCERTRGLRTDELVAYWHTQRPWHGRSRDAVAQAIDDHVIGLIERHGRAMPGAVEALDKTEAAGLKPALATSSSHEVINAVIGRLDIEGRFSVLCSATEETSGKPDPAVYFTAARRLGIPAGECVAVEDSLAGVRSGLAAGMRVIAVPAPHQFHLPGFDDAHIKLRSLVEFSVHLIEGLATSRTTR